MDGRSVRHASLDASAEALDARPGRPGGSENAHVAGMDNELTGEQVVVDQLYGRLDDLRAQTRARLAEVRREGPSGSPQNRSERDAFATLYEDRIAQLEAVEERLWSSAASTWPTTRAATSAGSA